MTYNVFSGTLNPAQSLSNCSFYHTQWTVKGSVFGTVSMWFFDCVWNISGTAERICIEFTRKTWSLAWTSLKVKGQGHQGQKRYFLTLSAACVRLGLVKHL